MNKFLTILKNSKRIVILISIIVILLIVAAILFFTLRKKEQQYFAPVNFTSKDSSVSLSVSNQFSFSEIEDESLVLTLKSSSTGSGIYISKTDTTNIKDFMKYIEADKNAFIASFPDISNLSDVSELTIQGLTSYTYHFNYRTNNYVEVYWILKDSSLYVIDFDVHQSQNDFSPHITEVLDSLKFN